MRVDVRELFGIILLLSVVLFLLFGCSPEWHFNRAQKKGLELVPEYDTLLIIDTIKGKDGKDSVIYSVKHEVKFFPKYQTRWKTRFDNKRFNDSLRSVRLIYKDSLRYALRNAKNDTKEKVKTKKIDKRETFKDKLNRLIMIILLVLVIILSLLHILRKK